MNAFARRCAAAIRQVGSQAELVRDGERAAFAASVQPRRPTGAFDGDALGTGGAELFTMYAPCGGAADGMGRGERIDFAGSRYRVVGAETVYLAGEAVYRRAVLRRESGNGV